jgi:hypothetical protein
MSASFHRPGDVPRLPDSDAALRLAPDSSADRAWARDQQFITVRRHWTATRTFSKTESSGKIVVIWYDSAMPRPETAK